jgi:vitamin B12/bleomycin/antimicrobial peptide transport system ATP-binding/permease protein
LLRDVSFALAPGDSVLVTGPSGCGKSTLVRAFAGLLSAGDGTIQVPRADAMLFLPQKPYLPLGTLGEAVAYPSARADVGDDAVNGALEAVGLAHLISRRDDTAHWAHRLLREELPKTAVLSIGHRSTLRALHARHLVVVVADGMGHVQAVAA